MKTGIKFILRCIPAVLCMMMIFIFSSHTAAESSGVSGGLIASFAERLHPGFEEMSETDQQQYIESWQFLVRKTAHFSIYALLGLLLCVPVSVVADRRYVFPISLVVAGLYAVSDEIHQYFVPGRSCEIRDMMIDFCGAVMGCAIYLLILEIIQKNCSEKEKILRNTY